MGRGRLSVWPFLVEEQCRQRLRDYKHHPIADVIVIHRAGRGSIRAPGSGRAERGLSMLSTMMDMPLTIQQILWRMERLYPNTPVVTQRQTGPAARSTYGEVAARAQRLA